MPAKAPALSRGLEVLRHIQSGAPMSLERIARETGYPKSSLTRILSTLVDCGILLRDVRTKRYRAIMHLVPGDSGNSELDREVGQSLARLAELTGQTAEWYIPSAEGMVIARRAESPSGEVRVRAYIGFLRPWVGELDAVATLAVAWHTPRNDYNGYNGFTSDGVREDLPSSVVRRRVENASRTGILIDHYVNDNGVRRGACVVLRGDAMAGILTVAQYRRPNDDASDRLILEALQTEGRGLTRHPTFQPTVELPGED